MDFLSPQMVKYSKEIEHHMINADLSLSEINPVIQTTDSWYSYSVNLLLNTRHQVNNEGKNEINRVTYTF